MALLRSVVALLSIGVCVSAGAAWPERPLRYVLASGSNLGGSAEEMKAARDSLDPVLAANPNLTVHAQVSSNHSHILRKDFHTVADAVRATAR